jgi:hypothetical protein
MVMPSAENVRMVSRSTPPGARWGSPTWTPRDRGGVAPAGLPHAMPAMHAWPATRSRGCRARECCGPGPGWRRRPTPCRPPARCPASRAPTCAAALGVPHLRRECREQPGSRPARRRCPGGRRRCGAGVPPPNGCSLFQDEGAALLHHRHVAAATGLPILLYQAPVCACWMPYAPALLAELASDRRVIGIKECSWEAAAFEANRRAVKAVRPDVAVLGSGANT